MKRRRGPSLPLSLDRGNERVNRGDLPLRLTPKAFEVLCYLIERPGRLVTKDEMLMRLWPDTVVTEASLSTCVHEIRRALDDDAAKPLYIQTVHRRGYRYVGTALEAALVAGTPRTNPACCAPLVGRERELKALDQALRAVEEGERRLMFLAGEAGIGKTTLVEHFVAGIAGRSAVRIARGQCVEQYGACEPYLPWFDVLDHLAGEYGRARVARMLRRFAPMWLAQLPWLINAHEREGLRREIAGATRERMMRELAEALGALAAEGPIVIILEDLHWSDPSSIGLLAYLVRRQRLGRFLLLGTYRPEELHVASHPLMPLKQELLLHGACEELRLDFLTMEAVAEYVRLRLPGAPNDLAAQLHRRTDGSPLFMVNLIDYLLAREALVQEGEQWHLRETARVCETEVPESLKEMIERQLDRLSHDERRVLEAGSVAGVAFSAATVAAIVDEPVESAEERLSTLARRASFVRATGRQTWPDGTQSDGFEFIHALYQNVLYERIGTARCSLMHLRAGERLEAAYGKRAGEIAAVLALHFQRGRDSKRAVRYLAQAGESAIQRGAYVEAIALLNQGLALLTTLPEGANRDACELQLRMPLGVCYVNTRGYAAPEVGETFERAHTLCRLDCDIERRFRVLRGVWIHAEQRADLQKSRSVAEELLSIAKKHGDASRLLEAHRVMAATGYHLGNFPGALYHLQQALAWYDPEHHASHAFLYGQDPGVCSFAWRAWTQWYLGCPDQAVTSALRSVELARQIGDPFSLSYALNFTARLYLCRREPEAARIYAGESIQRARKHGLTQMIAMGQVVHGWSRAFLEHTDAAISELQEGVTRWRSTGARLMTPYWMFILATALDSSGKTAAAENVLNSALAESDRTGERWCHCEMYIMRAALATRTCCNKNRDSHARAQRDLREALRAATELESPALRLRAANALSPLLRDQGRAQEARELLGTAYAAFDEGFETVDLTEARAELAQLQ